jgi:hypothetical protein
MSEKLGSKKKREVFQKTLESSGNDSYARVELYRWQHGNLPPQDSAVCKPLSVPAGLRSMAMAFCEPPDNDAWPHPFNIASVFEFCAKQVEKAENTQKLYDELVMAVAQKHLGETRHDSALRYIQERENKVEGPAQEKDKGRE